MMISLHQRAVCASSPTLRAMRSAPIARSAPVSFRLRTPPCRTVLVRAADEGASEEPLDVDPELWGSLGEDPLVIKDTEDPSASKLKPDDLLNASSGLKPASSGLESSFIPRRWIKFVNKTPNTVEVFLVPEKPIKVLKELLVRGSVTVPSGGELELKQIWELVQTKTSMEPVGKYDELKLRISDRFQVQYMSVRRQDTLKWHYIDKIAAPGDKVLLEKLEVMLDDAVPAWMRFKAPDA